MLEVNTALNLNIKFCLKESLQAKINFEINNCQTLYNLSFTHT